jgi:phosphoribosylanthranilate isomerase
MMRAEDIALAADLGADAVGFNFVGGPRQLTWESAQQLLAQRVPLVGRIGLFKEIPHWDDSEDPDTVVSVLGSLTETQLYPAEKRPHEPSKFLVGYSFWLVFHVTGRGFSGEIHDRLGGYTKKPSAILLDTAAKGQLGGTGKTFDWNWIAEAREAGELKGLPPMILAGGLHPGNVAEAIRITRPYAVDVSSGVEVEGKPGIKDVAKVRDFIAAVRGA